MEGTFTVNAPISIPTDEKNEVSLRSNPFNCGYSFYLGGGKSNGSLEVDAGLQWLDLDAQEAMNDPHDLWPFQEELVGWAPFINCSVNLQPSRYTSPKYQYGEGFLPWRGSSRQPAYWLRYMVTAEGYLGLTIAGPGWPGGTVYCRDKPIEVGPQPGPDDQVWPSLSVMDQTRDGVVQQSEFRSLYVKRSIAITQKTGAKGECDGTEFDCSFSGGKVYQAIADPLAVPTGTGWLAGQCNQSETGYDVDEFGADAIDQAFNGMSTPGSAFKMAFPPPLGKPARHAGSENIPTHQGRCYSSEDVHISLINGAWPTSRGGVEASPR